MKIDEDKIKNISRKLRSLPKSEKVNFSKRKAIKALLNDLELLFKRGYTTEQVVAFLKAEGLELTTLTLRSYLTTARASAKAEKLKEDQLKAEKLKEDQLKAEKLKAEKFKVSRSSFVIKPDNPNI